MFRRRSEEEIAHQARVKQYGGCPPCQHCEGSGEVNDAGCDPCWSTGIEPGPSVPPRSVFLANKRKK
jgi:hypothetical protein